MVSVQSRIKIRLLIADDHAIFRDGLRKLLDSEKGITIVGEAGSSTACIKMLGELKPDILLLDLRMPDKNALAVLEEVNLDTIWTRVIVLTAAIDNRDLVRALRLGARGVVLKESAIDLLVKSIHHVHAGEIWLDSQMTAEVINAFSASSKSGTHCEKALITDREMEIVQLVAQGIHNKEIGKKLFISGQTVKNHLRNIFDKLGVSDRLELMLYAIRHRWIDKPEGTLALTPLSPRTHKRPKQNPDRS
jgi:DNA-binding NarL/FixJ family response regulator